MSKDRGILCGTAMSAYKWIGRGLLPEYAVKKVIAEEEVAQNCIRR